MIYMTLLHCIYIANKKEINEQEGEGDGSTGKELALYENLIFIPSSCDSVVSQACYLSTKLVTGGCCHLRLLASHPSLIVISRFQ